MSRSVRVASVSLAVIAALSLSGPARAATVNAVQGQVLVNSGQGYRLVDGSAQLGAGATVVANPGAVAHVVYPGGCTVTVQPGSVYRVAAQAPCQTGEPTKIAGLNDSKDASSSGSGNSSTTYWLIGGAVAAGAGGAALYFLNPFSP
jgi:hypothetical protein